MNINSKDYQEKVENWINELQDITSEQISWDSYYTIKVSLPPFKDLVIDITRVNDKPAVVFYRRGSFLKAYFYKELKEAFKDYDADGKYMFCANVDNKFWFYEERIQFGHNTCSFGMDMTMPFLTQQNWKVCEN